MLQIEYVVDRVVDSLHECGWEAGHRASNEPPVVDRSELIVEQVRASSQVAGCCHTKTERLGIVQQLGGQRNDQCRWMIRVEQRLGLDNQDRLSFSRFCSMFRIQVGQPHFSTIRYQDPLRWWQTRD